MTPNLDQWAIRHGISPLALADLRQMLTNEPTGVVNTGNRKRDESYVQNEIRLEASRKGVNIWRNNVGACQERSGRLIRYGLNNDSKAINERMKSADLVGIRQVLITPDMVGSIIGQFVSREIKRPGWVYTGTKREVAQMNWALFILARGGDACFASRVGSL